MAKAEMLRADSVEFGYGARKALDGVSMSVLEGEFAGIIGPNGSGKSTFVKAATGVLSPSAGRFELCGRPVSGMPRKELGRTAAVVPQESFCAYPFTASEIVMMGRSPYLTGLGFESQRDVDAVAEAMRLAEVEGFASRRIDELSSGERQRVFIAKALAQEPRVLFLDEPTSFLDIKHQQHAYALLRRLNRERGLTVIVVSHDLNLASQHCDRLFMFKSGKVRFSGTPAETLTEKNIREVYEAEVEVDSGKDGQRPYVFLRKQYEN